MNALSLHKVAEKIKIWGWAFVRIVLIFGLSFVILYPILQKLAVAFKDPVDLYNRNVVWIPEHFTLRNLTSMIKLLDYQWGVVNTFSLSAGVMIVQTIACALAGYAFAKLRFWGSSVLFGCALFTILVPPQTIMVPLYMQFKSFDVFGIVHLLTGRDGFYMLDSFWPLLVASLTGMGIKSGLFIYIFRQVFRGLPKELEEAGFVDGAGIGRSFVQLALPNAVPAIVTVMLFTFVWQWNDTFFSNMYMGNTGMLLANKLSGMTPWINHMLTGSTNTVMADPFHVSMLKDVAVLLMMSPLIILYLFVQRYFVESVERTGLTG
jgi:multiple sugar transport system permease protein